MGFGAIIQGRGDKKIGETLAEAQPEDLLRYGLIPELVGRLPVVATLHELDEAALVRILVEPRNALLKQYEKIFGFDGVKLSFTEDAIRAVAQEAARRYTGARGLRSILEDIMLDVMYEIPSQTGVAEVMIGREMVIERKPPIRLFHNKKKAESA